MISCVAILASLVAALPAAPATASDSFHGVQVVERKYQADSSANQRTIVQVVGPYRTNTVVFINWDGQIDYLGSYGFAKPHIALSYNGGALAADSSKLMLSGGAATYRTSHGERLFLRKGESKTVSLVVEAGSPADGQAARATARLEALAIASRD